MINHNTDCSILNIQVDAEFTDGATYGFMCDVLCVENLKHKHKLSSMNMCTLNMILSVTSVRDVSV